MQKQRILFLDVDGVLNRCGASNNGLETDKVQMLRRIIKMTGCRIVLSSTWRKYPHLLKRLEKEFEIFDTTPVITQHQIKNGKLLPPTRGDEISLWLKNHPETKHFVIVDDDHDMGDLTSHAVFTNSFIGLDWTAAQKLTDKLKAA